MVDASCQHPDHEPGHVLTQKSRCTGGMFNMQDLHAASPTEGPCWLDHCMQNTATTCLHPGVRSVYVSRHSTPWQSNQLTLPSQLTRSSKLGMLMPNHISQSSRHCTVEHGPLLAACSRA